MKVLESKEQEKFIMAYYSRYDYKLVRSEVEGNNGKVLVEIFSPHIGKIINVGAEQLAKELKNQGKDIREMDDTEFDKLLVERCTNIVQTEECPMDVKTVELDLERNDNLWEVIEDEQFSKAVLGSLNDVDNYDFDEVERMII